MAQERGIYGTGHHRDLREFAPKATLCSSAWTWDKHLTPTIKKIMAGNWEPSPDGAFPGIKDGGTDIACCNAAVPKAVVDKVMAEREAIIGGKHVYAGPLKDTDGNERVPAGKTLDELRQNKLGLPLTSVWLCYDFDPVHGPDPQTARDYLYADGHVE